MTHREKVQAILDVLESFAPADYDMTKLQTIWKYKGTQNAQLRAVTGLLYDGLAYGNWPWVK